jgi:hypothetical protein
MTQLAVSSGWVTAWATVEAAVGTVLAFVVAFVQINRERVARLEAQADRLRRQRREQAERISGWLSGQDLGAIQPIAVHNASVEPVYRAVVWMVFIQGAGPHSGMDAARLPSSNWPFRSFISVIPPGTSYTSVSGGWGALSARPGVELAFTDRAGVRWLRAPDGRLVEIDRPPTEYYGIDGPHDWRAPERDPPERRRSLPPEYPPEVAPPSPVRWSTRLKERLSGRPSPR